MASAIEMECRQLDRIADLTQRSPGNKPSKWLRTAGNAERMLSRLLEESGEIAGAVKSYFGRPLRPEKPTGRLKDVHEEIGDTLVILYRLCTMFGITPSDAVDLTLDKYERRLKKLKK